MHRRKLLSLLDTYHVTFPEEAEETARFRAFVERQPDCFSNQCLEGHVTGSAWVVDPSGSRVLLTHHRKLDRWFQLGGHSDGDPDTTAVATREAEEESGLAVELIAASIFDLDIHLIPARGADPDHFHFDVRFGFVARSEDFKVSAESRALAWVPVSDLAQYTTEPSMLRMQRKWEVLAAASNLSRVGGVLGLDGA